MRRKKMLVVVAVFSMLFGLAQVAGASTIPNRFVSTDGDSNVMSINFGNLGLTNGWYFGVYDENPSGGLDLLLGSGPESPVAVSFAAFEVTYVANMADNHYQIKVIEGISDGSFLDIGDSDDFSFYFRDDSSSIYDTAFTITEAGELSYLFSSYPGGGGNVVGVDLAAIPLPSSAILLFSGFAGLVAFGRRRKIMK